VKAGVKPREVAPARDERTEAGRRTVRSSYTIGLRAKVQTQSLHEEHLLTSYAA